MFAVSKNELEAQQGRDKFTDRQLLSKFHLKLCGRARFWAPTDQEQVVRPIYSLRKSGQNFVEFFRELWRASTGRNKPQVPRFNEVTSLLDVMESRLRHTQVDVTRSDQDRSVNAGPVISSFE